MADSGQDKQTLEEKKKKFQGFRNSRISVLVVLVLLLQHLTCLSASPKQIWSQRLAVQDPSCFFSVTWHGEALYRLGVQGFRVLFLFFLPSVAPAGKHSVWSAEGLPSTFEAGSQWAGRWAVAVWRWRPTCSFSVS
jgi:hypothetical protein